MKVRQLIIIVIIISIASGAFLGLSQLKEEPEKVDIPEKIKYVHTEAVKYNQINTEIIGFGRVVSSIPLDLISEVQGKILKGQVPLRAGQNFSKGTILFKIDHSEALLNLKSQKAGFLKDLATILPDMKIDFPNRFSVWENYFNNIEVDNPLPGLPEYETPKEKTFLATKNIFTTYYSIKSKEVNLSKFTIKAPFRGSIDQVNTQVGSFVTPGTRIARVTESEDLELKIAVSIDDRQWIKQGAEVKITDEHGHHQWNGSVLRIADLINPTTQSMDVYINIKKGAAPVYDGMYLKAVIPGGTISAAVRVPRKALFSRNKVYVVQDSLLKIKEVIVHRINAETAVISGLKPADDLVVEPLINAFENMQVALFIDKPASMSNKKDDKDSTDSTSASIQ